MARKAEAPFLSAEWINAAVGRVLDQAEGFIQHILDDGLLSSGYLPFESPLTDALLRRMTPEQFSELYVTLGEAERQQLVDRLQRLRVPWFLAIPED